MLRTALLLCTTLFALPFVQAQTDETQENENVNMTIGVGDQQMNVNMNVGTTTTRTTTTTTTTTTTDEPVEQPAPPPSSGCGAPMGTTDFNEAKESIAGKGFEESKLTVAKQVADNNCMSTSQIKEVMGLFGFEETKLAFAKYAYDHASDRKNYYKLNDAFSFESSISDLDEYIKSK